MADDDDELLSQVVTTLLTSIDSGGGATLFVYNLRGQMLNVYEYSKRHNGERKRDQLISESEDWFHRRKFGP